MCLDLLEPNTEQMKSCCCSVFSTSCLCVSFLTSFLCSDCGFAVTVGLAARQLFLPQLSEQRPALRSSSTAVLGQSAQSDSCTTAPSTLTQSHTNLTVYSGRYQQQCVQVRGWCCVQGFTAERCSSSSRSPLMLHIHHLCTTVFGFVSTCWTEAAGKTALDCVFNFENMFPP